MTSLIAILIYSTYLFHGVFSKGISAKSPICKNVSVTEQEVVDFVFAKNTPWVRPVKNARQSIDVSIRLILTSINDVIERDRIVKLTGYLTVKWNDELHIWNDTLPYACLDSLIIPTEQIWVPDVATINSETHYDLILSKNVERIRLYSNGTVSYRPGGTFMIYCNFDLRYFPFDEQTCLLQLESWRYTHPFQTLSISDPPVSFRYWIENEQWLLVATDYRALSLQYVTLENVFDHVEFEITMRRKVGYYLMNVIIPSVIISIAQMAVFTLPVDEVMKIHISFTCLLAYGVFQLMIIQDMPRSSDHIPLLSIYIDLSMAYIAASMLCEGIVFVCLRKADDRNYHHIVPSWLYRLATIIAVPLRIRKPAPANFRKNYSNNDKNQRQTSGLPPQNTDTDEGRLAGFSDKAWWQQFFMSRWDERDVYRGNSSSSSNLINNNSNNNNSDSSENLLAANNHAADESYPHRHHNPTFEQMKWQFVADVIDRCTLFIYLACIISTPVGMFGILPNIKNYNRK